jgi:hypothetical protein
MEEDEELELAPSNEKKNLDSPTSSNAETSTS